MAVMDMVIAEVVPILTNVIVRSHFQDNHLGSINDLYFMFFYLIRDFDIANGYRFTVISNLSIV